MVTFFALVYTWSMLSNCDVCTRGRCYAMVGVGEHALCLSTHGRCHAAVMLVSRAHMADATPCLGGQGRCVVTLMSCWIAGFHAVSTLSKTTKNGTFLAHSPRSHDVFAKILAGQKEKIRHSRTGMAKQMADALHLGASDALIEMEASTSDLHIEMLPARDAQVPGSDDVVWINDW